MSIVQKYESYKHEDQTEKMERQKERRIERQTDKQKRNMRVVYFDQRLGAAHSKCWSK